MRFRQALILALLIAARVPIPALGDTPQSGTVEGQVTDADGAPLAGVTVTLSGPRGDQVTATDEQGGFRFGLVVPGDYALGAALEGLGSQEASLRLEAGERERVDFKLTLGTEEEITVQSVAPQVNKYEVGVAATVESEVAEALVYRARNYHSMFQMFPGVVQNANSQTVAETRPAVNGTQWQENAGFIDGIDTSNTRSGGSSRVFLPVTSLAEVRLDSSGAGAEFGRLVGGVINAAVKSGTNAFHGDFLYIAQNQAWRAQSDVVPLPREDDIINGFEVGLGGPVVRDRAWFFVSAARNNTNEMGALASGVVLESGFESEPWIAKLNAQPSPRHQLALLGIDAPVTTLLFGTASGDEFTPGVFDNSEQIGSLSWSWVVHDGLFTETRLGRHDGTLFTNHYRQRTIDPAANPDSPFGNQSLYRDLATGLAWNAIAFPEGESRGDFPRDQANAVVTWFAGSTHELKAGLDYQDVAFRSFNHPPDRYAGRGYNPNLPGGFAQPQTKQVFLPLESAAETTSEILALFAQDRITVGDHLTLNLGLRLDDQQHRNDIGEVAEESTDLAPRLAAVYDVGADGRLLIKATAGRAYQVIALNIVFQEFARKPTGDNAWDEYSWNAATQRYDRFLRRALPALNAQIQAVEPYFKDELTLGLDWQFANAWAFEARAIWWEMDDLFWATDQFDAAGNVFRSIENRSEGTRDYRGLQLQIDRAFRDAWTVRANYTLSRAEGNVFGNTLATQNDDDYLEAESILDPATGQPVTTLFRHGRGPQDREHLLNVSGLRNWELGRHTVALGGYFSYRSGQPWGLLPNVTLQHPVSRQVIRTTVYSEPRDAHVLPDTLNLNLTGSWTFPLGARVEGSVRAEIANVTDEQEAIAINATTGQVVAVRSSYQIPRELRLLAGVRF
jgi:hypothetical protein